MLFIIYIFFLICPIFDARAQIQKYFCCVLVQMKSLEFAFEINWPLELNGRSQPVLQTSLVYSACCSAAQSNDPVYTSLENRQQVLKAYCPNIYAMPATVPINTLHPLDFPSFNLVISVEKFKRLSKICQMS